MKQDKYIDTHANQPVLTESEVEQLLENGGVPATQTHSALVSALEAILPIVRAFTIDELSVTTIDEACEIMPRLEAVLAQAKGGE